MEIDWCGDPYNGNYNALTQMFVDAFVSLGLSQWVYTATFFRSDYILDLIFTSSDDREGEVDVLPAFPGCGDFPNICSCVEESLRGHCRD